MTQPTEHPPADWIIVHVYTRAQAIEDGTLVDVTQLAAEAGFKVPVALTRAAWDDCVAWTDADTEETGNPQDETGRLWDVLTTAHRRARRSSNENQATFQVLRVPRYQRHPAPRPARLVLHIGPGDQAEPVITIGFPSDF